MKNKLFEMGARWLLGGVLREVAEGKRGPKLQNAYLWLQGRKTVTGFVLAVMTGAVLALAPEQTALINGLGTLAGVAVSAGLLDKTWRNAQPPAWASEALHAVVASGPAVAIGVALLGRVLPGGWGDRLDLVCLAVGQATAFLGAYMAEPPKLEG